MRTSKNGANKIKKAEGLRLEAYGCQAGVATIGYGHTKGVYMGQKISKKEAEAFFQEDLKDHEKEVNRINKVKGYNLNQNQFDSLVSFSYNTGKLGTLTKNRTKNQLTDGMKLYNKAGGKVSQGLVNRRKMEIDLFKSPIGSNININSNINSNINRNNINHSYRPTFIDRTNNFTQQLNRPITSQTNFYRPNVVTRSNSYYGSQSGNTGTHFIPKRNGFSNGNACYIF